MRAAAAVAAAAHPKIQIQNNLSKVETYLSLKCCRYRRIILVLQIIYLNLFVF